MPPEFRRSADTQAHAISPVPSTRGKGTLAGIAAVLASSFAFVSGEGCATSDQMLEKKRREQVGTCRGGAEVDCYAGPQGTLGRGACRAGRMQCDESGIPGECRGEVQPSAETCNSVDDDCDGIVDNGFERDGALCFYQGAKGACRTQGKWHCAADGKRSECDAPLVKPSAETCNGVDDDCDGETDEDSIAAANETCQTGKPGVCGIGSNKCISGQVRCVQNIRPGPEICNKLDDNCNGVVDEDCVSEEAAKKQLSGGTP